MARERNVMVPPPLRPSNSSRRFLLNLSLPVYELRAWVLVSFGTSIAGYVTDESGRKAARKP